MKSRSTQVSKSIKAALIPPVIIAGCFLLPTLIQVNADEQMGCVTPLQLSANPNCSYYSPLDRCEKYERTPPTVKCLGAASSFVCWEYPITQTLKSWIKNDPETQADCDCGTEGWVYIGESQVQGTDAYNNDTSCG